MEVDLRVKSLLTCFLLAVSLSLVSCRTLEDFADQKNYYAPDPHASGSPPRHSHKTPCAPPSHGSGGGRPSHGGGSTVPSTNPSHGGGFAPPTPSHGGGYDPPTPPFGGGGIAPPTPSFGGGGIAPPTPSSGGGGVAPPTPSFGGGGIAPPTPSSAGVCAPPTPSHSGGGYYNTPPTIIPSPSPVVPITPTPTTPIISTPPSPPFVPDPNSPPFVPGSITYWSTHPAVIWGIFGYWATVGQFFGVPATLSFGRNLSLQEALVNTRTDGIGELFRQGTASFLNSFVNRKFPFTTQQVREAFASAVASEKAAATQAKLFKRANEGHLKHY